MKKHLLVNFLSKFEYLILFFVLIAGFGLRLYKINTPLADHHSWRQADTAAVARNFARYGINLLYPQLDNFSPTNSPDRENIHRLYLVEFPVYNALVAIAYRLFGIKEIYGRLVTVLIWFSSSIILYLITKKFLGKLAGMLSILFFSFMPFNVYFTRVILPEPLMLFCILTGIYLFILWLEKNEYWYYLTSLFFTALAFLVKPYSLFLLFVFIYLVIKYKGYKSLFSVKTVLFGILSIIPFILWRFYISAMPEGIPASGWLFNEENIRFSGAFFRWLIFERMDKLILAVGGTFLFLLGLIVKPNKKEGWLLLVWLSGIILYFFVFAKGNVTHDYYQIIFIPIACIYLAKGAVFLLRPPTEIFNKYFCYLLFAVCFILMMAFGWYEVRNFYNPQMGVDLAGMAVSQLTPKNSLVITGDSADVTLLYNCDRFGWAIGYGAAYANDSDTIERLRQKGADFYVTTKVNDLTNNKDFGQYLIRTYKITKKTNEFIIFDLRKKLL